MFLLFIFSGESPGLKYYKLPEANRLEVKIQKCRSFGIWLGKDKAIIILEIVTIGNIWCLTVIGYT